MTWHPTPSHYTDTGPTCRCAIHWCGTSHWNTQLPILMSWVRSDREILPPPFHSQLDAVMVQVSRKLCRKYRTNQVLNPGPVVCEPITLPAGPQVLLRYPLTHSCFYATRSPPAALRYPLTHSCFYATRSPQLLLRYPLAPSCLPWGTPCWRRAPGAASRSRCQRCGHPTKLTKIKHQNDTYLGMFTGNI